MPQVFAFRAVQFNKGAGDLSAHIAPPYDVIDEQYKKLLLEKEPANIVAIDLPHTPPKELGSPQVYQEAASLYQQWLENGILNQRDEPALFAYRQTFEFQGKKYNRCGMCATVQVVPFGPKQGGGILPHEETFSGPKEDRFALMNTTKAQLSPIFGLHADDEGQASQIVRTIMQSRSPDMLADIGDGVQSEVWTVTNQQAIKSYQDALAGEDIFIADGHHRYTTALNYLRQLEAAGNVAEDHPARQCMMVLVSMSDPGLAIGPTHRVLGGMSDYTIEKFIEASAGMLTIEPIENDPHMIEEQITSIAAREGRSVLGLMDFATGLCFAGYPGDIDTLEDDFPDKPLAWRRLDVAIIQHLIVDQICKPELNDSKDVKWAFPHSIDEVVQIGKGSETGAGGGSDFTAQLAIIVVPTPLDAVREISRANELMPQKSTFFYPKLATGLFIHPLA